MPARFRPQRLALALAALPALSHALGLGALRGEAYIGEPLRVEIQLVGEPAPLGRECVAIQRPEQTPDDGSFPRNMTARVESRGNGQVIVLSTPTSVAMPILEFRIALRCTFNVSRDYSLLPLPRHDEPKAPPAEAAEPAASSKPAAPRPAATAKPARPPDGVDAQVVSVSRDMTVAELANERFRNQPMRRARFKRWVVEANPGLTLESRLARGQEVTVPAGIPPRRPGDRQDPVTGEFIDDHSGAKPAAAPATAPTARPEPAAAKPAASDKDTGGTRSAMKDQLKIGGENKPPSFRNMKEAAQVIDRLNTLLEQQLAEKVSAEDKLGKLETSVSDLSTRLEKAEANMVAADARNRAALQTAQDRLEAQEEHSQWLITLAGLGGLVVGAAVTLALVLLRRKPKPPAPLFGPVPYASSAGSEPPATDAATPPAHEVMAAAAATPQTDQPAQTAQAAPATAAPSAFHTNDDAQKTIKTVRPSLDFREALAQRDAEVAPPAESSAPHFDLDFELEPLPAISPDPLDFTPKAQELVLPSVFESLNAALPVTPEPASPLSGQASTGDLVELTNIMVSMGLANSAAETLAKHIAEHPKQSLRHWLKLMEVYRLQGSREAFERTAEDLRTHFNVRAGGWETVDEVESGLPVRHSLEDFPHLVRNIQATWREAGCVQYLHSLLTDNREGTRSGFSQSIAEELLLLIAILSEPA